MSATFRVIHATEVGVTRFADDVAQRVLLIGYRDENSRSRMIQVVLSDRTLAQLLIAADKFREGR